MKKKYILLGFGFLIAVSALLIVKKELTDAGTIPSAVGSSALFANVPNGTLMYDGIEGNPINLVLSGARVEVIKDRGEEWYYIRYKKRFGWVRAEALEIPEDKATNMSALSQSLIEEYANKSLSSKTEHFVWVDIDRQRIYILKGSNGSRILEKTIVCATGRNKTPTLRGSFEIGDRGQWFYSDRLKSGAMYWVRYSGSYLFHSVAMDENKKITDGVLGKRRSSGCVRMSIEDAMWFYENIERGTGVWIY